MVSVIRTNKQGRQRMMLITRQAWNRIVAKPNLVGGTWELAPAVTKQRPAPVRPAVTKYGQEDYDKDIKSGRIAMKEGDKSRAADHFKRAVKFKPTPYYKGLITKLK